jgi:hypothetical protein
MNKDELKAKQDQEDLSRAYAEVLETQAGKLVLGSLIETLSITVPVYAFGHKNELADISYRDGQRNAGIYVYNQIALANPKVAAELHLNVMLKQNEQEKARLLAQGGKDE